MTEATDAIIEPDLPICDPHHHLWDFPQSRYLLPELLEDLNRGHNVESTVFVECGSFYKASGPEPMKFVGETEFVGGQAAMAASGRYGPVMACEGIVGRADLLGGAAVAEVLESHVRAGNGRFKGIRHAGAYDPNPDIRKSHAGPPPGVSPRSSRTATSTASRASPTRPAPCRPGSASTASTSTRPRPSGSPTPCRPPPTTPRRSRRSFRSAAMATPG